MSELVCNENTALNNIDWVETIGRSKYPDVKSMLNIAAFLKHVEVELCYNDFTQKPMLNDQALNDSHLLDLWRKAHVGGFRVARSFFTDAILSLALQKRFHPVRDYLDRLAWDGECRIDNWLSRYGGAPDTEFVRTAGALWMIAAVRRIKQPGCKFDCVLVLEGPEGAGKSTAAMILAGGSDWFTDCLPIGAEPKVVIEVATGRWIVEFAELADMTRRDVETVKAMVTRTTDSARQAYGRTATDVPRQFVCGFRRCRPGIPIEAGHLFRSKSATHSGDVGHPSGLVLSCRAALQGAVRYEYNNAQGTGIDLVDPVAPVTVNGDRTFKPVSASAGVLIDIPMGVVMRLTAQHTERAPDTAELFSKGLHEATGTFEIGNPFLAVEKARTFELGFRRAQGSFRFDASLYHTTFDGFIFKRLAGTTCGETLGDCESNGVGAGGDLKELRFSQRDATFYGAELIGQLDVAPLWRGVWGIEGQYDFVHAEFSNGEYVPRIPPHRAGGGIYYRDVNWLAKVSVLHAFRQDQIGLAETPTSGYTLLNAELSYTQRLAGNTYVPQFTVGIKGDNLLNEDVRNHVSFKKDEVLLPGASVRLFGSIKLN